MLWYDFFSFSYTPQSLCKADIRNPLSQLAHERSRLVLYTLEASECLFYVQIAAILTYRFTL